ncbi:cobaltochelatase subunit CobN [Devosia rhodophyticola]|uniref:Cobaltochelatase subunit CobN n=1 Tax=Devosia rhodophyticola TaxID=3026423 RepID=A0ABY7YZ17_9HYPH|nr:cobaltochelatase subunit CobN [Devosia rhodophyticola]WDR06599.1 cobaltochelatase subunit CobN [Devosia rhodophyticola]
MHLLSAQAGAIQQDGEAIDLAQTPGALIFASAADSELAMLAGAADRAGETQLRLANTLRLSHNYSVDLWLEQTVRHAKIVLVRLLGGAAYWQYGVDELTAICANHKIPLALLPGDANPDPILRDRSTVNPDDWTSLHALFTAGGPDNADRLLAALHQLAAPHQRDTEISPQLNNAPSPFARFGLWHPRLGITDESLLRAHHNRKTPTNIPILFYRAALEGAGTATLEALIAALEAADLAPVPLVISSLKEAACVRFVQSALKAFPPAAILNLTGFALGLDGLEAKANPFSGTDAPIIQLLQGGRPVEQYQADPQGLSAKDLAMQIVLPELDGRIGDILVGHKQQALWHGRTQCPLSAYAPDLSGIARATTLAQNYARLRATPRAQRKIGLVLANYPIRDGRIANGVGYDAPQSTVEILKVLKTEGYALSVPENGNALIEALQSGPTNANPQRGTSKAQLTLARYNTLFAALPEKIRTEVTTRWGQPEADPFLRGDIFHLPALIFGNLTVLLQPARGYDRDDTASYHDPDLVPPHAYLAAYLWLRHEFAAHALIHNGKHGNLEWLPGKATALDETSYPDALWSQLPHVYPFIVNDPGEGTQAKRRTGATIIDHLVPPLTRAETYGPLKDLEALLDEYYAASGMDRRRLNDLKRRILDFTRDTRLDRDIALPDDPDAALAEIDNFLCDLKEAQIRDGLHVFGQSPTGDLERDLIVALARVPRGDNGGGEASIIRALADDLKLGFDALSAKLGSPWRGPQVTLNANTVLTDVRTNGDMVEVLETLAASLVSGTSPEPEWTATKAVLQTIQTTIRPRLAASGPNEIKALIDGLDGKFIAPGPSGAPSRGRLDVLPTGRNFYSLDNRAVPTPTAWELGRQSAENTILRHFQDHGVYLKSLALSVWGTANMRTGGDDIAQAMAFIGAKPKWDPSSLRVSGYEIIPLAKLGRPRIDVTLRISGFFRDAFPAQIALFDRAIRAVGALDEPDDQNPIAALMRADALGLMASGSSEADAALAAGHRIFGSKPGAYGAGLQALIDSGHWQTKANLADAFLNWGQYAYGAKAAGTPERDRFAARLSNIDAVVHNQDNREHDLLDSDDYYQFEGGLAVTAETLSGSQPAVYHNDHSRPEHVLTRTLTEEIAKVMRSRVVNPKWINGLRRHGYKGAFEIIATVDYMFAFAATTGAVKTHHFDLAFEAFVEDENTRNFIKKNNSFGYDELLEKFREALARGLWTPRSNSAYALLEETPHV